MRFRCGPARWFVNTQFFLQTRGFLSQLHPSSLSMVDHTKLVKLPKQEEQGWNDLVMCARDYLVKSTIIAVPTDTIYGLAGLAQSSGALEELYAIKERNHHKALSICVGDVTDVHRWGKVTVSSALLNQLLPGPVTVIFERTAALNPQLNPSHTNVGIRVPDCGFVRQVARACGEPLALTSANLNGHPSTVAVEEFSSLWNRVAAVYDGGVLGETELSRLGSTVVDLSQPGVFQVVRPGSAHMETVLKLQNHGLKQLDSDLKQNR